MNTMKKTTYLLIFLLALASCKNGNKKVEQQHKNNTKSGLWMYVRIWRLSTRGVYCIANTDGSNQMVLKNTDLYISYCPFVRIANRFFYIDKKHNLLIADNDKGAVVKIAGNVSDLKNRNIGSLKNF